VERFNQTYRTEVRECVVVAPLLEVGAMTTDWLHRYHHRLYEAQGSTPMVEYRVTKFTNRNF
jgi:putative transposase